MASSDTPEQIFIGAEGYFAKKIQVCLHAEVPKLEAYVFHMVALAG